MSYPTLYDHASREGIVARVRQVQPTSVRRWGVMAPELLLPHLAGGIRRALEKPATGPVPGPLLGLIKRWLLIHQLPWPKAKIQSPPNSFRVPPTTWKQDQETVVSLIQAFVTTDADKLTQLHPTFGRMTARDWGVLQYRHLDHHLRQFSA